jgi:hypothetical protein
VTAESTTRVCSKCGGEFKIDDPKSRRRVCNGCKARDRRRNSGGGGGRRTFSAAGVLARAFAPGSHGGGGGTGGEAISVNSGYYRDRRPGDGMPSVVVLRGDDEGMLTAMRGCNGWTAATPGLTLDQMVGYLAEYCGYALAGRDGQEVTLTRGAVGERDEASPAQTASNNNSRMCLPRLPRLSRAQTRGAQTRGEQTREGER